MHAIWHALLSILASVALFQPYLRPPSLVGDGGIFDCLQHAEQPICARADTFDVMVTDYAKYKIWCIMEAYIALSNQNPFPIPWGA